MTTSRDAVARTSAADLDRYSRQMRFSGIAEAGQKKLAGARVLLCGVGALGTVLANTLARAGVGFIRLVDRDFVELSNLQRQVLFDESDDEMGLCIVQTVWVYFVIQMLVYVCMCSKVLLAMRASLWLSYHRSQAGHACGSAIPFSHMLLLMTRRMCY